MNQSIVEIYPTGNTALEDFLEAVHQLDMHYLASSLDQAGFSPAEEIDHAVERSIRICRSCGITVGAHFRPLYVYNHTIKALRKDWKLSRLAYMLILLNGSADNPVVARMQVKVVERMMS